MEKVKSLRRLSNPLVKIPFLSELVIIAAHVLLICSLINKGSADGITDLITGYYPAVIVWAVIRSRYPSGKKMNDEKAAAVTAADIFPVTDNMIVCQRISEWFRAGIFSAVMYLTELIMYFAGVFSENVASDFLFFAVLNLAAFTAIPYLDTSQVKEYNWDDYNKPYNSSTGVLAIYTPLIMTAAVIIALPLIRTVNLSVLLKTLLSVILVITAAAYFAAPFIVRRKSIKANSSSFRSRTGEEIIL